jgi:hypothetical protein
MDVREVQRRKMRAFLLKLIGLDPAALQHVVSAGVRLGNPAALGWIVFAAILLGLFVWACYSRLEAHRALPSMRARVLIALRTLLLLMILALLLRPILSLAVQERLRRTVLLLVDNSRSMNIRDQRTTDTDLKRAEIAQGAINSLSDAIAQDHAAQAAQLSRADLAKAVLNNSTLHLLDDLQRDSNVETFLFDRKIQPISGPTWLLDYRPSGDSTAIGDSIQQALGRVRGQPLAGIMLITDGGNNTGSDPIEAAQAAARDGAPIFPYGVGLTAPRDIIVDSISAPSLAFAKDTLTVSVQLRGQGLVGETGTLSLQLSGSEVASSTVTFTGPDQWVPLSFEPPRKGDFDLTASIAPRPDEITPDNNSATSRLHVIDQKIKVLYVEQAPRWEFRFLQGALLRDRRIQPAFYVAEADPSLADEEGSSFIAKLPDKKEDLLKYDAVILGDIDPKLFTADQIDALDQFVSQFGGACIVLAGRNFTPEAWRGTAVEKMLPVDLLPSAPAPATGDEPIKLTLTPLGESAPMLRLGASSVESDAIWSAFPQVYWDAKIARAKPAAQVLAVESNRASTTGPMPIIATQQYGVGQVIYIGTDELWRMRRNEGVNQSPLLWGQIVQGAALAHLLGSSRRTQISVDQEIHNAGDNVTVYARLYNERFQPLTEPTVPARYTVIGGAPDVKGSGEDLTLTALPGQPGSYRGDFIAYKAGRYSVSTLDDPGAGAQFECRQPQFELGDTAMNEPLLRQIATTSGGRFFHEEDLPSLAGEINRNPETIRSTRDLDIWSSPLYFIALCCVASTEWALRKRWNLK